MLEDMKLSLRVDGTELNGEVQDLIDAAKIDLILSGVSKDEAIYADPLIKRAITLYCKAHFGYEDIKMSNRLEMSYISLKQHLSLSQEYSEVVS